MSSGTPAAQSFREQGRELDTAGLLRRREPEATINPCNAFGTAIMGAKTSKHSPLWQRFLLPNWPRMNSPE